MRAPGNQDEAETPAAFGRDLKAAALRQVGSLVQMQDDNRLGFRGQTLFRRPETIRSAYGFDQSDRSGRNETPEPFRTKRVNSVSRADDNDRMRGGGTTRFLRRIEGEGQGALPDQFMNARPLQLRHILGERQRVFGLQAGCLIGQMNLMAHPIGQRVQRTQRWTVRRGDAVNPTGAVSKSSRIASQ